MILVVDDEPKLRALLSMALTAEGMEVKEAESAEAALDLLGRGDAISAMITDVRMPGMSGLDLVKRVRREHPGIECIVMTAYADSGTGVEAMRNGAFEYVTKPFEMDEMVLLIRSALEKGRLREEVAELRVREADRYQMDRIIGDSKAIQDVIRQARMVAKRDTTVVVRGKSGTGKELVARGIHAESGRDAFVAVNCGSLPENLLDSELFGHEKGSFPGAHAHKIGYFERAGAGTIFLDEIGDVSPAMQVKLLRVLQDREFVRVGGTRVIRTQARVIAATHLNLEEEVKKGAFREDLYFRLNVFPIFVPSLVEHLEDVPAMVDAFLTRFGHRAGITEGVLTKLMEYSWPGNVRELENCLERAAIIAGNMPLETIHLPEHIRLKRVLDRPSAFRLPETGLSLDELEKSLILQALEIKAGNKTRAAGMLGITRRALYSKMHTHGIKGYGPEETPEVP
ncbi:MAG: two component, sigma54 specific, transcriptional regulator, Fis family [Fibrobacteres bacterium]|nr:two component, sigma54 specific, transcriptional regulator, Fis family [Fibrobacterota bacterium]